VFKQHRGLEILRIRKGRQPLVAVRSCDCHIVTSARGEEPSLAVVLQRAGAYVTEFQQRLSGIVADER
jgi:hypothetical protein